VKVRLQLLAAASTLALVTLPTATYAQRVAVGVGVHVGGPRAVVRVAPRAVVYGGYYRGYWGMPYYYGSFFYDPWFWSGGPYGYPGYYGYPGGYYYGGSSLRIEVKPNHAEVYVDGYYAGVVDDFDGVFQSLDLPPGEHAIELYLPGYRSVQQKVYLQPHNTFKVKYTMQPLQPGDAEPVRPVAPATPPQGYQQPPPQAGAPRRGPARPLPPNTPAVPPAPATPPVPGEPDRAAAGDYGTLALRVQPPDAEIVIDGERWTGSQPGERLEVQLATGVHNVEIRKDGYRTYSTEVTVRGGQTATLNVALTRQ